MKPAGAGFPSIEEIQASPVPKKVGKGKAKRDLSLDLSSSCVGWALGVKPEPLRYGKFVFKTTAEIGEKLVSFEEFLYALLETYEPDRLLVEKPPARRGVTTARHFELIGIVRKVWRDYSGGEILRSWFISPITVKKVMGVRKGGNHEENKKIMVNKINSLFQLSLKFHPSSGYQSDDDTADALAVLVTVWNK